MADGKLINDWRNMIIVGLSKRFFTNFLKVLIFLFNISLIYLFRAKEIYLEIDNQISEYEENIDFSNYSSDIKILALYSPSTDSITSNYYLINKEISHLSDIEYDIGIHNKQHKLNSKDKFENNHYNTTEMEKLKIQINLAKSHGIYGFAIYYLWFYEKQIFQKTLELFLINKNLDFHFLLILENKTWNYTRNIFRVKNEYMAIKFIKDIKKYMNDKRYIRINNKAILGISDLNKVPKFRKTIKILRTKAKELGIGELFIIAYLNENLTYNCSQLNYIEAGLDMPQINSLNLHKLKKRNIYIYNEIIYKYYSYEIKNFNNSIFRGNIISYNYYSLEQFYMLNKIIIEWTLKKYKSNKRFIFVDLWNDENNSINFEQNQKYGYALMNSLSKALFNLSYIYNYNLQNIKQSTKIAIQVHVYYENLIFDIIQKTNNMPVNFDLYISTDTGLKKEFINKYISEHSKASKYEIRIFNNKGRDVLPLLIQLKKKLKYYKYFCHIHTKKSKHIDFGEEWRNYLFQNLLGSKEIISEILTEFENNFYLGIIFPEIFYKVFIAYGENFLGSDYQYMEQIIKKISSNLKISITNLDFPMGNMFWARVKSVHQLFKINLNKLFPEENKQLDGTLMHGVERIWLYIVKYNGFSYKKIFKHL